MASSKNAQRKKRSLVPAALILLVLSIQCLRAAELDAPNNSTHLINVTSPDGRYVVEPVVASDTYDQSTARDNSERIRNILKAAPADCTIHFPAGVYYFDGAAPGWTATIQSTHDHQTFTGDGINASYLCQKNTTVPATIRIEHPRCVIKNLSICSADSSEQFNQQWNDAPHQAAIHLAAPSDTWYTDPQIRNVTINSIGNNIVVQGYFRPFSRGIKITGPWLNVYVEGIWMQDVLNAIYIEQGARIAGPAKFVRVNAYATPESVSKRWNIFFHSENSFMEQVELIHCTYIGSQFIRMKGSPVQPGYRPIFDMVIDHNYINTAWLKSLKQALEAANSGIYFDLPPMPDASNYSRDIRFTNNSCTAKAVGEGSFFYLEGNCRGVTFADNDVSCGGDDKCIYIRASRPVHGDVAVRDIKITGNYFRNFKNPITIGDAAYDPSRTTSGENSSNIPENKLYWNERVQIRGNQTQNWPSVAKNLYTTCFIHKCRQVTVANNSFGPTDALALAFQGCRDVTVIANNLAGLQTDMARCGIWLRDCEAVSLSGNTIRTAKQGIAIADSSVVTTGNNTIVNTKTGIEAGGCAGLTATGNSLKNCRTGLSLKNVRDASISANQISGCKVPVNLNSVRNVAVVGNALGITNGINLEGKNQRVLTQSNTP